MEQQFLPFLTDDQGRSLDVSNGIVVTSSLPDPLENSPEGWENNTIQLARNNEFRGIIKSYTTSLKFYLDGATILRNAFYRIGMEAVLYFIWLKLDQSFGGGMQYRDWYKGEPDLSTFKDMYDGVEVNITEGGYYKDLQANKTKVQEIPFGVESVNLFNDGMTLYQTINYGLIGVDDAGGAISGFKDVGTVPIIFLSKDGDSYGINYLSVGVESISDAEPDIFQYVTGSNNWFAKNDGIVPITITITGKKKFYCVNNDDSIGGPSLADLFFETSTHIRYYICQNIHCIQGQTYEFTYTHTITLQPDEKLFSLRWFHNTGIVDGSPLIVTYDETSFDTISSNTKAPSSIIPCQRAVVLGQLLSDKVSSGSKLTSPTLLDNDYNLLVTCGPAIRRLPGAVIKSSFSDWHKSIDAVKCIALSVENNSPIVSSRYDKFNRASTIGSLGECANWELEPAEEYVYDTVAVGYPAKSADSNIDLNGRYSFNNTFKWALDITRRKQNEYDAVSKYSADPYDIELMRINFNGKDTTAANSDSTNFFIDAEIKTVYFSALLHFYSTDSKIVFESPDDSYLQYFVEGMKFTAAGTASNDRVYNVTGVEIDGLSVSLTVAEFIPVNEDVTATLSATDFYQLRRPTFASITGLPNDGSIYNILLSPRRILENHLRWLHSSFDNLDSNNLVFKTTEKNRDLQTVDLLGNIVDEDAPIPIANMGSKVFLPYYTSFEVASPRNLLDLLTANSSGKFDYAWGGVPLDGFVVDVKSNDTTLETQTYKLLLTANNNLISLINNR